MKWKEINLPALTTNLSTAPAQPLTRNGWPTWTQATTDFVSAWLYPTGNLCVASTAELSTGHAQVYVDFERRATEGATYRYYRFAYAQTADGRVFQSGPIKDLEYGHHRWDKPSWLASPLTAPSS